ncbi:putative F-box protein At4g17565 [Cornus florida]|uniref:putative F-box protein At4g17565 n=1 Tax=Cornus florida TaxID=4283 RepID=UPI00289926F5|nr:putative F-box protein At4g17565 [Cornus florida]
MGNNIHTVGVLVLLVPWSDLPQELLELIMAHVTTTFDLLRCRGVCHSWRSAALNVISRAATTTIPLLLLYNKADLYKSPAKLLCLGKNTTAEYWLSSPRMKRLSFKDYGILCNVMYPELIKSMEGTRMADDEGIEEEVGSGGAVPKRTRCVATYRGWLLLYPFFESALYLFNPLSRMVVHLPPPPKRAMVFDPNELRFITSSNITEPTCMVYLYNTSSFDIAIYKLSDREWTPVFTTNYAPVCVVFYNGNFYSVDEFGVLRRFLFDKCYSNYKEEVISNGTGKFTSRFRYLVESWSGELLMVAKSFDHYYHRDDGEFKMRTKLFEIFKLNWSNGEWEEMTNFGDQALFLAHNDSKFVSVRYNSKYKPNSIYFIDDIRANANSFNKDFGVYDLANHKVEPLNLCHDQMQERAYHRWFQPVI